MKQCPVCGMYAQDQEAFCRRCGADLTHIPPMPPQAQQPPAHLVQPAPPLYTPKPAPVKRPFTWADVATFLGFCASVLGYFGASLLFFPLGIVASVLGFQGERTREWAVAGIVVATLGLLLKIMRILEQLNFLPGWFISGVW